MTYKRGYDGKVSDSITELVVEGRSDYYSRGDQAKIEELDGKMDTLSILVELMFKAMPAESKKVVLEYYKIEEVAD